MIHVIIPVFNRLNYTIKCLYSLKNQKNYDDLKIIVVDDGSTDGTKQYLKNNFPQITVLNGSGSLFWGGAISLGIEYVIKISQSKDWVLLVNNDVELSQDAISNLIKEAEKRNRKVIVGALTINAEDKTTIITSGTIVKSWFLNITKHVYKDFSVNQIHNREPIMVDFLTGRSLLHPVEIFNTAGNYDAQTFPHYGADDEFSMRVKKYGYLTLLCSSSIVFLHPNEKYETKKINFKNFFFTIFGKKSSSNIINKFNLTLKVVPFHAKISFFLIGIMKSVYIFLKNDR